MSKNPIEPETNILIAAPEGGRIDRFLAEKYSDFSRSYFQKLINDRAITVDGHPVSPHQNLRDGQTILIVWPKEIKKVRSTSIEPLPFPILFEDEHVMVINKPAGLLCHPVGAKREGTTLVEILRSRVDQFDWPDEMRPGLVHRLDRDTSGVLVFAKTPEAHAKISKQFANRQVKKMYLALVDGVLKTKQGTFEGAIGRHPQKRQRFAVIQDGRRSVTNFKVAEILSPLACLVELYPLTGRTHQLRVHLSTYHHPILGDRVYGRADEKFNFIERQMLHASRIEFTQPFTLKKLSFEAPLPSDFQAVIKIIRSGL